ncbi:MAG TPA: GNAT family N-acetyltransferase [Galbitalea sp.]
MSDHPLSPIAAVDAERAYGTILSAFIDDPVERWLLPEDGAYAAGFPAFVASLGEDALETSTAWQLDDFGAVAMWLPPGTVPDAERIGAALIATVAQEKYAEMFAVLEQMDAVHPRYPHWYLPWLGVRADKQNQGLGGRLLAASLEYVDLGGLPAYLESPNPRNIPFYEHHGFVVTGRTDSATCPPITFMLRPAQR